MSLKYLVTILYQPRETMRRILDSPHRWALQVVALAAICTSVNEINTQQYRDVLPAIDLVPGLALAALGLIATALSWIVLLFILSWIATPLGRLFGGTATFADARAALAWAMVPMIWSPIYRIPFTVMASGLHTMPRQDPHKLLVDFVSRGGCSFLVVYLFFQLVFELACVVIGSFTLAEAQRVSSQKGFLNVVIMLALPVLIALAAVMSMRS